MIVINCRVLKNGKCQITQKYTSNHQAIDLVGDNPIIDEVIAHSDGEIVFYQDGYDNLKGSINNDSYGNCIKLKHDNNFYTLYAHLEKNLPVKNNQIIKKGQIIGKISNSGNAYGKHLHFEVWKNNTRIDPTNYLNQSFKTTNHQLKYSIGSIVKINGVYLSSTSEEKLIPTITEGKITKIIENAKNPYLLENGKIGWVNDSCIIENNQPSYLSNTNYKGFSIVDGLKQINIDSSFDYRTKLAKLNDIENYTGTSIQNNYLLNLLKTGKLKYK